MLHTQITRLIKHKVVFIRKLRAHAFLFFSRHPLWFMNSTKHVTHSTHFPAENESVLLNITKLFIRVLCSPPRLAHQMAHHGFLLHSPGLPPTSTGVFYKPLFKTLCLIGWSRETPLLPKSSCGPKVSKRSIFADLLARQARFSLTNLTLWPLIGLRKRFPYRLLLLYFRHLHSLLVTRFWTTL